jgi:hypothetical protein
VENRRQLAKTSGADRGLEAVALTAHPLVIAVKRLGLQLRFEEIFERGLVLSISSAHTNMTHLEGNVKLKKGRCYVSTERTRSRTFRGSSVAAFLALHLVLELAFEAIAEECLVSLALELGVEEVHEEL